MTTDRNNPTQPNDPKAEPPAPATSTPDGPPEIEDAARQEVEYPEDETNEG